MVITVCERARHILFLPLGKTMRTLEIFAYRSKITAVLVTCQLLAGQWLSVQVPSVRQVLLVMHSAQDWR